jgi:hypothetical protein
MSPVGIETKKQCAGEDQQQLSSQAESCETAEEGIAGTRYRVTTSEVYKWLRRISVCCSEN